MENKTDTNLLKESSSVASKLVEKLIPMPKWISWVCILFILIFFSAIIIYMLINVIFGLTFQGSINLKSHLSMVMFFGMITLYITQLFAATWLSLNKQSNQIVDVHGTWTMVQIPESTFSWTIRDFGSSSGPWILLIVAIFLPTMLSFIPHTMQIFLEVTETDSTNLTLHELQVTGIVYYFCVSLIAVLVTMEASVLMNLRDIGGIWTSMILASMVIDIIGLFFLHSIDSPLAWKGDGFESGGTGIYMFLYIFFCFLSSFFTILFARANREMIFEALVLESGKRHSQNVRQ